MGFELELASFRPGEVAPGPQTRWDPEARRLSVGAPEAGLEEPGILGVHAEIVRPGEPVRIVNVLDAVEPQAKERDPEHTFPGAAGSMALVGTGRSHRLNGVAVISAAAYLPSADPEARDIQDGFIDMGGPGAPYTPWSSTTNVVLTFERAPGAPLAEVDAAIRRTALSVARDLAATTRGSEPDHLETLVRGPADPDLPPVCVILQLGGQGPLYDTFVYGRTVGGLLPTPLDPNEVLDGAITAGAYHWAALRNPTYCYQRSRLVLELLAAHGQRVDFRGVVVTHAYTMGAEDKRRQALLAAKTALQMGARGAILTTDGGGNSHTDTMLTCRACEQLGIGTTVIVAEMGGLTDRVPEADVIVSTGNADELVPEWTPQRVIGGDLLVDGRRASEAGPIPVRNYLAATNQMGQSLLRGVSW